MKPPLGASTCPVKKLPPWLARNQIQMNDHGEMIISKVDVPDEWRPKGEVKMPETWLAWEHPHKTDQ